MSQWVIHVRKYSKDNNVSYKDAMSLAKDSYQSETKTKPLPKPKVLKPNKKLEEILPALAQPISRAKNISSASKAINGEKPAKKRVAKKKPLIGGSSHICAGCGFCNG